MQGTREGSAYGCGCGGLIPARAGHSLELRHSFCRPRAHPCACRALLKIPAGATHLGGSSLRVQGTHKVMPFDPEGHGLIPARAGHSPRGSLDNGAELPHPCACRALSRVGLPMLVTAGSSLRVQGTQARVSQYQGTQGAHPCACRALNRTTLLAMGATGSSLRVQGTLTHMKHLPPFRGLIPARAGHSRRRPERRTRTGAHPCACRALSDWVDHPVRCQGSSLRVQGTHKQPRTVYRVEGLIPARAGHSALCPAIAGMSRAHPCACRALT